MPFNTQHVQTQEEGKAPVVEACDLSAGMLVTGPTVGPGGLFVADAFTSPSAASPGLLIVGCSVEGASAVIGTASRDSRGTREEGRSFSGPEAESLAPVAAGSATSLVCKLGRPEMSDVGIPKLLSVMSVSTADGFPAANVFDGFEAGFEAKSEPGFTVGFGAESEPCGKPCERPDDGAVSEVGMS